MNPFNKNENIKTLFSGPQMVYDEEDLDDLIEAELDIDDRVIVTLKDEAHNPTNLRLKFTSEKGKIYINLLEHEDTVLFYSELPQRVIQNFEDDIKNTIEYQTDIACIAIVKQSPQGQVTSTKIEKQFMISIRSNNGEISLKIDYDYYHPDRAIIIQRHFVISKHLSKEYLLFMFSSLSEEYARLGYIRKRMQRSALQESIALHLDKPE